MFDVRHGANGELILSGRLDSAQADRLRDELKIIEGSCELNFADLDYISSACLGVLLGVQRRLSEHGHSLTLTNMSRHIRELFSIAGFSQVFIIK